MPPWDFEFETYQQYAEQSGGFIEERLTEGEEPIDEPGLGPIDLNDDSLRSRLQNSFAAAVTSFDAELAGVIDLFRAAGLDKSATWIFTSGYGCPLGEHGIVGLLGSRLHEELVHLPLMVRLPDGREAMRRVSALTRSTDLGPTILSLLGLPHSGLSLLPLMTGTTTDSRNILSNSRRARQANRTRSPNEYLVIPRRHAGTNRPACIASRMIFGRSTISHSATRTNAINWPPN